MEPGEIGRHGAAAPKPVEKERRAGAGIAIPLQQLTEERSVQGREMAKLLGMQAREMAGLLWSRV